MKAGREKVDVSSVFGNSQAPGSEEADLSGSSKSTKKGDSKEEGLAAEHAHGGDLSASQGLATQEEAQLTMLGHDGDTSIIPVRNTVKMTEFYLSISFLTRLDETLARDDENKENKVKRDLKLTPISLNFCYFYGEISPSFQPFYLCFNFRASIDVWLCLL